MEKRLPKGWKMVKLGEVCAVNPRFSKPHDMDEDAVVSFVPMADINKNNIGFEPKDSKKLTDVSNSYTFFKNDDVLLAKVTPCFENGKAGIARNLLNNVGFGSSEFYVLRSNGNILPEWIYLCVTSPAFRKAAAAQMTGTGGLQRVPRAVVEGYQIPLPPLPTQRKIAGILQEADSLRKLRKQADEKMQELVHALFVEMFGDPATNPKGWEAKRLDDICVFKRGPFGGSLKKEIFVKDGFKVYEQKNAIYNDFNIGDYFVDEKKYNEMIGFAIQSDDLIISCSGTMGKIAIIPQNVKKGIINQALLKITPNQKLVSSLILKMLIESKTIQDKYFKNTAGSAMQNVTSVKVLKNIEVPLPPLHLQQDFAARVEEIEAEKARQAESKNKLDELFGSFMQRAFTGELVA